MNETKLTNYIGEAIHPAVLTEDDNVCAGFIGPMNLAAKATIVFDSSLKGTKNICTGANKEGYHYVGFNIERDYGKVSRAGDLLAAAQPPGKATGKGRLSGA